MDFSINQIHHTSHCGSTLLAVLLSQSSLSYAEPACFDQFKGSTDVENFLKFASGFDSKVVKFKSIFSYWAPHIPGKKVFLYNTLTNHLFRMYTGRKGHDNYLKSYTKHTIDNLHPFLKENFSTFENDSPMMHKLHCLLWMNRVLHMMDTDALWVEANQFFTNMEETTNKVCDHFGIDHVKDYTIRDYYVKERSLWFGSDRSINSFDIGEAKDALALIYPSRAIIDPAIVDMMPEIKFAVDWFNETFEGFKPDLVG